MKKVPSYPKITSKTNITVTHTQNININSPKGMSHIPSSKKLFKNPKGSTQARQDSELRPSLSKLKPNHYRPTRRPSSGNLHKGKVQQQDHQRHNSKHNIKKIQQKLKDLEKKIDTLRHTKKKKQQSSQRKQSRIKQSNVPTNTDSKTSLGSFMRKQGSSQKVLKKTQSDKYLLKKHQVPKQQNNLSITNPKEQKGEDLIHQFVTQVAKSETHNYKSNFRDKSEKVVCYYIESAVESIHKNYLLPFREHLSQSVQTIKYLKNNRKPNMKELQRHSVALPPHKHKYSLILDLDQTLIHCNQNLSLPHDVTLKIKFPTGEKIDAGVNVRPHAKELLRELSKICQVIVFTASHECYANVVVNHLDPKNQFVSHRLFRGQCWQTEEGVYIKDLRVLKGRNLSNILLVDNAAYSYFNQLENGIPIVPYYDDKDDQQLLHLVQYVKELIQINDTQEGTTLQQLNHKYFQLSSYMQYQDIDRLTNKLYKQTIVKHKKMVA